MFWKLEISFVIGYIFGLIVAEVSRKTGKRNLPDSTKPEYTKPDYHCYRSVGCFGPHKCDCGCAHCLLSVITKSEHPKALHCFRDPAPVGACNGPGKCSCECSTCLPEWYGTKSEHPKMEYIKYDYHCYRDSCYGPKNCDCSCQSCLVSVIKKSEHLKTEEGERVERRMGERRQKEWQKL